MVERLVTQFRALLGGRGADAPVDDDLDDLDDELAGLPGPDPEWDELLAWAREADDEVEWTAVIARAKETAVAVAADEVAAETNDEAADEAAEWRRLLALAKSNPATSVRPTPAPLPAVALRLTPAAMPLARPPVGSIASLSARLERLAAQVPAARRRRAR